MIKKCFFLLSLLALLLLLSCTWFSTTQEETIEVPAGISAESSEFEEYAGCVQECNSCEQNCIDSLYYTKALSDENANVCSQIISAGIKQECEDSLTAIAAVSQLNKDKCLTLSDEAAQQNCLVHVTAEIAVQSNNVEKCQEATNVERCEKIYYKEMALLMNDASYCDSLSDIDKELCYEVVG